MHKICSLLVGLFVLQGAPLFAEGKFIDPISDVCWECLFPITVSGVNVTPDTKDFNPDRTITCVCGGIPPKIGVPLSFWEPSYLVDVTRHAYKLIGLGGVSISKSTIKDQGAVSVVGDGSLESSYYHVHLYRYPVLALLGVLTDFFCVTPGGLDMAYLSEMDPIWNDDQLAIIMNPESALFGNPLAQLACIVDCTSATARKPLDQLFWCAGCSGSLYPFTGTVAHHQGGVQASILLVHRCIAKMHRSLVFNGYEKGDYCDPVPMPVLKKSLYKTQIVYPVAQTSAPCHFLGESSVVWGAGKSFPGKGESFVYLVWKKKQCCLDALKPVITGGLP